MDAILDRPVSEYGLEELPASVKHLAQLVARKDASAEETAQIIAGDEQLAAQLLRAANPGAERTEEYTITTVEQALARAGTGWALILAVSEPLTRAVKKTFQTMLSLDLEMVPLNHLDSVFEEHIVCETVFNGKITGSVQQRLTLPLARQLGAQLLGITASDLSTDAALADVMGELANMVGGTFKSNLCDAGLNCHLNLPKVSRVTPMQGRTTSFSAVQRFGFRGPMVELFVDLTVNPWGD